MPVRSQAQWRLMAGIAHGWHPSHMKHPPSAAVAREYVKHGKPRRLPRRKRRSAVNGRG